MFGLPASVIIIKYINMPWSEWILMLSLSRCNAPGAWYVTGWVLAWQTPRDMRDERPGQKWKWRSLLSEHITHFSNLFPGGPYSMLISLPPCDVGGALWSDSLWTSWHGSRDASHSAWHSPGPRSSPEARVTKIILVPGMDRENVNTAGSLEIRLYRISFPASGHEVEGEEESSASEKSWIVLTTSYIFILTKYLPRSLLKLNPYVF